MARHVITAPNGRRMVVFYGPDDPPGWQAEMFRNARRHNRPRLGWWRTGLYLFLILVGLLSCGMLFIPMLILRAFLNLHTSATGAVKRQERGGW